MSLIDPTEDLLQKLTCESCKNYLSSLPIYIKRGTTIAICGRCKVSEPENYVRDDAYEDIAQFLNFSCINKENGCNEVMPPSQLEKHEECCMHLKNKCPVKNLKCPWSGPRKDLTSHFQDSHPNLLIKNSSFELSFLMSSEEYMLLALKDELFIVKKEVDSRKGVFSCTVQLLKSTEDSISYNYFLKVYSKDKNYSRKYPAEKAADGLDVSRLSSEDLAEVLFESQCFIVTVEVMPQVKIIQPSEEGTKNNDKPAEKVITIKENPNIEWEVLSNLECPVCYDFMLPPIYQCLNGHSLCEECKLGVKGICPVCKSAIQDTQNFTLQKVTQLLNYPCKFYKSGCNYYAKSKNIREHEGACEFGPMECPFQNVSECPWKEVVGKLRTHIDSEHKALLKTENEALSFDTSVEKEEAYLIKFEDQMFKILFKHSDNKFKWSVQLLGPKNISESYRFNLQVLDDSGKKRACHMVGVVVPLNIQDPFSDIDNYVMLHLDNIKSFFVKQLRYKVNVLKFQ